MNSILRFCAVLCLWLFLMLVFLGGQSFGQLYTPSPAGVITVLDNNGDIVPNCYIYTYVTATSTPATTYSTPTGTANANPVRCDSAGRASIFLNPAVVYRLLVEDASQNTLYDKNGIQGPLPTTFSLTAGFIPIADSTGTNLIDSICSQGGTTITCSGGMTTTGTITAAAAAVTGTTTLNNVTINGTCTGCSSQVTRPIPGIFQELTTVSGLPVMTTVTSGAVVTSVVGLTSGTNSSVGVQFVVPSTGVATSGSLTLTIGYQASTAPGATNNKVKLTLACQVDGVALSTTAGDTITLANNTAPATYTGSVNIIASGSYTTNSNVDCAILRDTSVANNAAVYFYIRQVGFNYVASQ